MAMRTPHTSPARLGRQP